MRLVQLVLPLALLVPRPVAAQQPAPANADRVGHIVAVVGDSAITNISLGDAVVQRFATERRQPVFEGEEYERIRREVLEAEIDELLLLHAAQKDTTIQVDEERLRKGVDQQLAQRQREVGGIAQFDQLLVRNGTSLAEFRDYLTAEMRKSEIIGLYLSRVRQKRQPPPVADRQLRAYFEENRQALETQWGPKPALITLDQIVLQIPPSDSASEAARIRADSVFLMLRNGEDFEQLARRYTEEPGGRDTGGDLGWIKESEVVREFARVAFGTPAGVFSSPFLSSYGWHILKVERRRGAEAHVRHILFMPAMGDADLERAMQRADSIAGLLRTGAPIAPLARQFGDPDFDTRVGPVPPDEYGQRYGVAVTDAVAGSVIDPAPFGDGPARRLLVARVVERTPAGTWSLEDSQVREFLENQVAQNALLAEVVEELRRSVYVKVFES